MSERQGNGIIVCAAGRSVRNAVPGPRRARCFVRWIFALATLLALVFVPAGPSRAQSQGTASKSAPAAATTSAQVAVVDTGTVTQTATPKPAAGPAAPAGQSAAKGQREGIKVHGHWTIEVRNPDGTVVSQTEFENALSPGFSFPIINGLTAQVPGGGAFLSALMAGQAVITPGNWAVLVEGTNGPLPTANAPCITASGTYGSCFIFSGATIPNFYTSPLCAPGVPDNPGISCNLTVSPLGTAQNLTGFQLSGSVAATLNGTISAVATMNFDACAALPNCSFVISAVNDGIVSLTARNLDGNTTAGAAAGDPNPVPVAAQQTVSVTVQISFQ